MPEVKECRYYIESIQKKTPPPIWEAKNALYPHNFSHHKSRKKFAPRKHNFSHQKYSKKSACLWKKNFGKNLRENISG